VLEPSEHRLEAPCPIYGECGGCNLMHLSYQRQVEAKSAIVSEALRRNARLEYGVVPTVASIPFAYRNRVQLHFSPEGRVGYMRRGSAEVIEASTCPIALKPIQTWIEERAGSDRGWSELREWVMGKERFLAFGYGNEVWIEGRQGEVEVRVAGEPIHFHLRGFFQSNLYMLDHFVADLVEGLSGDRAADLYSGVGLFGRFLAKAFSRVVCVEENPFALGLARKNVPGEGHEFSSMSIEDWVASPAAAQRFDCVLVDPPRTGLSAPVRRWLIGKKVPQLAYASCDPVTLARDIAELVGAGYRLEWVKGFDFYPQTSHVECNARLSWA
ncbi:MAG TPA: methyltransferase, partial [Rectinemataceae bacterium]|nr:methyltransferase [Rectinemataceae bacterium]